MTMQSDPMFILGCADATFSSLGAQSLSTKADVQAAFKRTRRARWITDSDSLSLVTEASEFHETWHRLLVLGSLTQSRRALLSTRYRVVVAPGNGVRLVSDSDLAEIFSAEHPENLLIGGIADSDDHVLILYRGSLEPLVVPFNWFKGGAPNFDDLEIIDNGQTIRLGSYEASVDALLYEFDAQARAQMKSNVIQDDDSFGGALRRLRLLKGLSREDFAGVTSKTIARIERGEVATPQAETIAKLATVLGVEAADIEGY